VARLALIGGAYFARSVIANCQRAINYFPEPNAKDAPVPMTHYQRPGLKPVALPGIPAPGRCLYRASNGNGYAVIGADVFAVGGNWALTKLGSITQNRSNLCSMIDNGQQILLVDGSINGWTIDLATNAFNLIVDPTGAFTGADRVDTLDTFILWNKPDTRQFGSTLSNQISPFDPLQFASKARYPDFLQTVIVCSYEIILLGTLKGEIFYNIGNPQFPFAALPGTTIEHGISAIYSVASYDTSVFWLGQDLQGEGLVFRLRGYETKVISNYAIANAIAEMKAKGADVSDAVGYCYQQNGHVFYVLSFAAGDQTWVFDDSISEPDLAWHQRAWTDSNGVLHRVRDNCFAFLNGVPTVADWENGTLYQLDANTYTDTVASVPGPISFIRTFPHSLVATDAQGRPQLSDGHMMQYSSFIADIECGMGPLEADGTPASVTLRWSLDRGRTYQQGVLITTGAPGEYITTPTWMGLGSAGRDWVFELSHSIAGPAALNGAWVDAKVLSG
jgi:hypothetical protein